MRATLKQIKIAIRAAMKGVDGDQFVMTFKRGDRFTMPCKGMILTSSETETAAMSE